MGKNDYDDRKKSKSVRKRLRGTVDFVHGVEAAKRRRKAGRRRHCEGMCYSLPTLEDPFNDKYEMRLKKKKVLEVPCTPTENEGGIEKNGGILAKQAVKKKSLSKEGKLIGKAEEGAKSSCLIMKNQAQGKDLTTLKNIAAVVEDAEQKSLEFGFRRFTWKPSLDRCLAGQAVLNEAVAMDAEDAFEFSAATILEAALPANIVGKGFASSNGTKSKRRVAKQWDWDFWKACGTGLDVLATCGTPEMTWATAYVLAAAAHIAERRRQQGFHKMPLALFIVTSQEQALKVRTICRPLKKKLGIQSVSLHEGTPIGHQIEGLEMTAPTILVGTPDRLCDLVSSGAVSLSNITFLVVDGLKQIENKGLADQVVNIRSMVHASAQSVVFADTCSAVTTDLCRRVLRDPISRVTSDSSVAERCVCITQAVSVFTSEEKKIHKLVRILKTSPKELQSPGLKMGILVLVQRVESIFKLKDALTSQNLHVECFGNLESEDKSHVLQNFSKGKVQVLLATEDVLRKLDLGMLRTVVNYDFPSSMKSYSQILTGMCRSSARGILYSFCSGATALLTSQLVQLLQHCSQPVPTSLTMLSEAACMIQQSKLTVSMKSK